MIWGFTRSDSESAEKIFQKKSKKKIKKIWIVNKNIYLCSPVQEGKIRTEE